MHYVSKWHNKAAVYKKHADGKFFITLWNLDWIQFPEAEIFTFVSERHKNFIVS